MLTRLPDQLYTAAQTREFDRTAIQECGIPGYQLMCRAGMAVYDLLCLRWPAARNCVVVCGAGNNGGDGFVVGRHLVRDGRRVQLVLLGEPAVLRGDALRAYEDFIAAGGCLSNLSEIDWHRVDVVVDALFGSGLSRNVRGMAAQVVREINGSDCPVVAVDVPSGLDADSGSVLGVAVMADVTVSFIGCKRGLFTHEGPDHAGEVFFDDLDVPREIYAAFDDGVQRVTRERFPALWRQRASASHKGSYGHVAVLGGAPGMVGAARMAGESAMRVGAGRVTIVTSSDSAPSVNRAMPELMSRAVDDVASAQRAVSGMDVVAVGPGLGQSQWAEGLLAAALAAPCPKVFDADALNLIAKASGLRLDNAIATPHPAEAARLLGTSVASVQGDRFAAINALQESYGGVWLLKGNGTLIADESQTWLVDCGNPGMASAGMGDVLTGVIAGLLAQGNSPMTATVGGAWLHAMAGDAAAQAGEAGLVATDLLPQIRALRG